MAISCMCNAFGHNYWNSSFIVDLAMGQIPRFTERISTSQLICCLNSPSTLLRKTVVVSLLVNCDSFFRKRKRLYFAFYALVHVLEQFILLLGPAGSLFCCFYW